MKSIIVSRHRATLRRIRAILLVGAALAAGALATSAGHAATDVLILTARTGDIGSGAKNGDGHIDAVTLSFSGPMTAATPKKSTGPGDPGLRVDGYEIDDAAPFAWQQDGTLRVNLVQSSEMDTGATPTVRYEAEGGLEPVTGQVPSSSVQALDGAGPVLKAVLANDQGGGNMFNAIGDEARIVFSEPSTIAGATPLDRWTNLERVIRFTQEPGGVGCSRDGIGVPTDRNFPQPGAAGDPMVQPNGPADYQHDTFVVRQKDGVGSSPGYTFAAIPSGCWVGVDEQYFSLVTDEAGNVARHQSEPGAIPNAHRVKINPTDADITAVKTVDGSDGPPNGTIDALEVHVNQNADDATLAGALGRFRVADGDVEATVTAIESGQPNDRIFTIRLGAPWGTGVTPTLTYTKPSGCTSTGGTGVKATLPTPGWRACLGTTSITATDAAPPMLIASRTRDSDGNGIIDRVRATFSEAIASGSPSGWEVDGKAATAFTIDQDPTKASIDFPEGDAPDTDALPMLRFTGTTSNTDAAGNRIRQLDTVVGSDGAAPRIYRAYEYDRNGDGGIEHAVVEFSEPLAEPASAAGARFTVGGKAGTIVAAAAGTDDPGATGDEFLSLSFSPTDGTGASDVVYTVGTPAVSDPAGNAATAQTVGAASVVDRAVPIGVIDIGPHHPVGTGLSTFVVDFSEAMDTSVAPAVTFGAKTVNPVIDLDHTPNGWRTADTSIWEGTFTVVAADCAVPTGCPVTATASGAKDPVGNTQVASSLDTEIDTIAPQVLALTGFTAAQAPGEPAPADVVNMFTNAFSLHAAVEPGHAEGGTAEMLADGAPFNPPATDASIGGSDTTVTPTTAFATRSALQQAVAEGTHTLTLKLCDDARNCTTSTATREITADYTPVEVALSQPGGGELVRGGSNVNIAWDADETAADFDHVELHYSTNGGASYQTIDLDQTDPDGSFTWRAPSVETGAAKVRASAVDVNGNKDRAASGAFAIDSTAPVVRVDAPSGTIAAGGAETIRWRATDATLDRVSSPIRIEYSANGGGWKAINGGSYSKSNDGAERWDVPATAGSYRVRVRATDAVGNATTATGGALKAIRPETATADFNGDGYGDIAIGSPNEKVGSDAAAGAVNVIYGGTGGLASGGNQLWTQDSPGIAGASEPGDRFGHALATGDFNRDGYSDLAIGVPGEGLGSRNNAGAVHVLFGSSSGLRSSGDQVWHQNSKGIRGVAETGDRFGEALAAADFNGDGVADLAIGAPGESLGSIRDAGVAHVLYGKRGSGLTAAGDQVWHQNSKGIKDAAERYDRFGLTLAAGDFDGNGYADLAVGVPEENLGKRANAGAVQVLYGSRSGITAADQMWHQASRGIMGAAEAGDRFGDALAAGDFDRDGRSDLAIGVPREGIGRAADAGAVQVLYGSRGGLSSRDQIWYQGSGGIGGGPETSDRFGAALAVGDFDDDGYRDLAIGVPYEEFSASRPDAGMVHVLYGRSGGLSGSGSDIWWAGSSGLLGAQDANDNFGAALAAIDADGDGYAELAIGEPGNPNGSQLGTGAVHIVRGSASDLVGSGAQTWTQNSPGIADAVEPGDRFGTALSG